MNNNSQNCPLTESCEYFRIDLKTGQCDGSPYPDCIYGNVKPKIDPYRCVICKKTFEKNEERYRYYNIKGVYCKSCAEVHTPGISKE